MAKTINMPSSLLRNYIRKHPAEVAAALEGNPVTTVKSFIETLPDTEFGYLMPYLSMKYMTAVTDKINDRVIEFLCQRQPPYVVFRIYTTLSDAEQANFLPLLPRRFRWYLKYLSTQSTNAISTLMTYDFLSLPEETKIEDARKSLRYTRQKVLALYSHDEKNKITGEINIQDVYTTKRHLSLADCDKSIRHALPPSALIEDVINLKIWSKKTVIPIVDHDQHLLGIVSLNTLFEEIVRKENEAAMSIHESAEQLSRAVYSVLNTLASSYKKVR